MPVVTRTPDDSPSVHQPNAGILSSTSGVDRYPVLDDAHTHTISKADFQEFDGDVAANPVSYGFCIRLCLLISCSKAVASTSSSLLPAETKAREVAQSQAINQDSSNITSEKETHERYMAKMELEKMKVEAKSEKLKIQARTKSEDKRRQCRLEVARMIFFVLVILVIQRRDMRTSKDDGALRMLAP
ncbi:hypothetical protein DL96DRAFT_1211199 [Flagelloscypha sp. PMI_526]|nr:hypothetical protein DL96DRAFT_1211199 [Flagelloscypha sp. PMI_526]